MSTAKAKRAAGASKPKKTAAKKSKSPPMAAAKTGMSGSKVIDQKIRDLGDWRGETLAHMRALIHEADPETIEEAKWAKRANPLGVPVWSHAGIVCTGESYKNRVKLTFAQGASLPDPSRLFNSSLGGGTRRAIDIKEGEKVDPRAFKALVKAAVTKNVVAKKK